MDNRIEKIVPKLFLLVIVVILLYWGWNGAMWLWDWYQGIKGVSDISVGGEIWRFVKVNFSVIVAVYGVASLQSAGLAELKFKKTFLVAFGLALCLTPPVMMGVYGHKRK